MSSPRLISGPVGPALLRMAGPMTVGMLATMCFNLVDSMFIGRLGQTELAAMAFTFPLVFFVSGSSMGLGIGVSSVVSRAIGAGEAERVRLITSHSLLLGAVVVAALLLVGYPLLNPVLRAMGATAGQIPLIRGYMLPWSAGIVFLVTPMLGNSVIRATGDTLIPSVIMLVAGGLNAALDPVLIFGLGPIPPLGLPGAALATVVSYIAVFLVMTGLLRFKYHLLVFRLGSWRDVFHSWREVLVIGLPAVFTNQTIPIANGVLTAMVARYGEAAVAAWGVSVRLESLMMAPFFALGTVMAAFVGQNTGAEKPERVGEALRFCGKACMGGGLLIWAAAALAGGGIALLFSRDPETIRLIRLHLWIVPASYGAFAWKLQYTSTFNAQRHPFYSSAAFLSRFFLLMIPLAWLGQSHMGLPGLFAGIALGNFCALLLTMGLWRRLEAVRN